MSDLSSRITAKARELSKQKSAPTNPATVKAEPSAAPALVSLTQNREAEPETPPAPTYREGKRNISAYHPDSVFRQFKILAAETDKTVQELHREALNLLFRHYDKPPIA